MARSPAFSLVPLCEAGFGALAMTCEHLEGDGVFAGLVDGHIRLLNSQFVFVSDL